MGKKRGLLLAVLFVALLGGLVWVLSRPTEPIYQGKPLGAWLNEFNGVPEDTNQAAFVAFSQMGSNAIPALLRIIQSDDSPLQRMILKLNRMQSLVPFPVRNTWPQKLAASFALYAAGVKAKPALPLLTSLLFGTNTLVSIVIPIAWKGSDEGRFFQARCPAFLSALPLAGMGSEGLPPLIAALTNQNEFIRLSAAFGLAWERSDLNIIVPALIGRLSDQEWVVHTTAVTVLGHLHAEQGLAVPALIKDFPGNDPLLRSSIMWALGRFETNARAAVPMLLEALSDTDPTVRGDAAITLKQIDPEAAAKAGVK